MRASGGRLAARTRKRSTLPGKRIFSPGAPPQARRWAFLLFPLLAGLMAPGALFSQSLRALSIAAENDGLAFWTPPHQRSDWYYTHGMAIVGVFASAIPGSSFLGGGAPPPCGPTPSTQPCSLSRLGIGQAIFTPEARFTTSPPAADRPYAGWLYLEASAIRLEGRRIRRLGLDLGVTGGPSLAGPVHRWFHRSLGKHEPMGWDSQIPFELAFSVSFENREALTLGETAGGLDLRFEHRSILRVGTLRTGALGGLSLQAGWRAPRFLEWTGIRPAEGYIRLSVGADGELVLRDLFLDGSTFGGGPRVERTPLVGQLRASLQVGTGAFGVEFSGSRRTSQFTGQVGHHSTGLVRLIIRP